MIRIYRGFWLWESLIIELYVVGLGIKTVPFDLTLLDLEDTKMWSRYDVWLLKSACEYVMTQFCSSGSHYFLKNHHQELLYFFSSNGPLISFAF